MYHARTDYFRTTTLQNHTTMITGRPVLQPSGQPNTVHHGYTNNNFPPADSTLHDDEWNPNVDYVAGVFDVAHDNGLSTAMYAGKSKFIIYEQSYNSANGAPDVTGPDNGTDKIDSLLLDNHDTSGVVIYGGTTSSDGTPSSTAVAGFAADLDAQMFNFSFVHTRDTDKIGHTYGWGSHEWNLAAEAEDGYLGAIFDVIENNATLKDHTAIILTADHGGTGTGHGSASDPANYTVPLLVWGPGVAANRDLYELNPTTRLDPGTGRPDYNAAIQPIRNGEVGNLALDLLGLGAIPGSSIDSAQDLAVPEPSTLLLLSISMIGFGFSRRRQKR